MQGGGFFAEDDYIEPPPAQQVNRQRGVPPPPRKVTAPVESDDFDYEGEAALDALERQERGMVLPPPPDDHAPRTVGICEECGEASGQPKFFAAFGVSACYDCQQAARGPGGKYELIIKTKVKGEYFLTDRQGNSHLPFSQCHLLSLSQKASIARWLARSRELDGIGWMPCCHRRTGT